jgi:hypothetical protein
MTMIFGCGLSRTGNKSLGQALKLLGYRPVKYPKSIDELGDTPDTCNAAVDITVIAWLDELETRFPDAKWILTVRDVDEWLDACDRWFARPIDQFPDYKQAYLRHYRQMVYGADTFDRVIWREAYHRHMDRMKVRFGDRPDQFLVMNICGGDTWDVLCQFLNIPIPDLDFPSIS